MRHRLASIALALLLIGGAVGTAVATNPGVGPGAAAGQYCSGTGVCSPLLTGPTCTQSGATLVVSGTTNDNVHPVSVTVTTATGSPFTATFSGSSPTFNWSATTGNLAPGSYTVSASQSNATGTSTVGPITCTVAQDLVILTSPNDGGGHRVHFTGSGAVATTTITVTICTVNSFPCSGPNTAATSVATNPTAGNWASARDTANLAGTTTYYAQAVQGTATSNVYNFTTG